MSKQNSVQWFLDKLIEHRIIIVNQTTYGDKVKPKHEILLEQAKAIHKEEMVDFGNDLLAQNDCNYIGIPNLAEQYYNETFGGNNEKQ
jgi:hypothetical protein